MKFLVIWSLHKNLLSPDMIKAVLRQPDYAQKLEAEGKVEKRYHIVGGHGGAWIYSVGRMRSWSGCWRYPLCTTAQSIESIRWQRWGPKPTWFRRKSKLR